MSRDEDSLEKRAVSSSTKLSVLFNCRDLIEEDERTCVKDLIASAEKTHGKSVSFDR